MFKKLAVLIMVMSPLARAAEPVGLLSLVSGDVQIIRAGASAPVAARTADLIGPGDRVLTGANSEAMFLYCPESRAAKMTAQSEIQFDATALAVKKGKLDGDRKVPTCRLPASLVLAANSKMQAGNMRLRDQGSLRLRTPSNTSVASLRPHFRWDAVENAATYEIKVQDREEHVLWKANVTSTDVQYPPEAAALAWGQKYRWHLTARSSDDQLDDAGSTFQVMPSDQAEKVNVAAADLETLRAAN